LTVEHGLTAGDQIVTSGVLLLSEEFQQHAG